MNTIFQTSMFEENVYLQNYIKKKNAREKEISKQFFFSDFFSL